MSNRFASRISDRMRTIQSMVIPSEPLADVGTDHGFIALDLLDRGIVPKVLMTDISEGPLSRARAHAQEAGFSPELWETRLGPGLGPIGDGEVSTVVIAGMGGEMIQQILSFDSRKTASFRRFILQPRTHCDELRSYLTGAGFALADYALVRENGRICQVFAWEPCGHKGSDPDTGLISEFLIQKKDPLLKEFICERIRKEEIILSELEKSSDPKADGQKLLRRCQLEELTRVLHSIP